HPREVDRAFARTQVFLVTPVAVSQAHLATPAEVHRIEEAIDALGDEMSVVDRERPAEARRLDAPEILTALLQVVSQVADLGVFGLAVEVLQQEARARALGVNGGALQALDARLAPRRVVAGKVVAAVDDDPLGSEAAGQVDVGPEILLGSLGQERRRLRDV